MLLVISAIRRVFKEKMKIGGWDKLEKEISFLYYENQLNSYAGHMGFYKSFAFPMGKAPGEAPGNNRYIPIKKLESRIY
ncbi:hypothetical protein [Neobacillus cucumis]|uniref:hypothetical protein n=1 Tax=Neobacillus cucumis TaxID=1740721 RepID=UPI002E1DADBB|nr:hypothetical protein [Neobacillus cucumis]